MGRDRKRSIIPLGRRLPPVHVQPRHPCPARIGPYRVPRIRTSVVLPAPVRILCRLTCGKCRQTARREERWQRRGIRRSGRSSRERGWPLPNVGGGRYGAGMPDQPDPGDSPPSPPPPGRKPPGGEPSPHDAVFRRIFGVPANAASQLRAVLPPDLAARLDLGRLARVPGSFVDEALKWRHSDLLFTAPLDGQDAFVYVLVEHQSSDDPLMAFRMLRYVTRIWDQYEREHPETRRLPAVIPLVVYHGRSRWTSPVQLLELIDLGPADKQAMQAWLPRFGFLLDDLTRADEDQLLARDLTPAALVTLLLLKNARGNPAIAADLRRWAAQLRAVLDQPGGARDVHRAADVH